MAASGSDLRADTLIIQFARSPLAGQVKTRMLSELTPQEACDLHQELVLWTCEQLCSADLAPVELWVSGDMSHPLFQTCCHLGAAAVYEQQGTDLGQRMSLALADGLSRYRKVILVGSDCPEINTAYLQRALAALESSPVVLGPADDGGYVLVGATEPCPEMFADRAWGHNEVFAEAEATLRNLGVNWQVLESLPDIDRPEDLPIWLALKQGLRLAPSPSAPGL